MSSKKNDEKEERDILENKVEDLMDLHGMYLFYENLTLGQLRRYVQCLIKIFNKYDSGLPLTFDKTTFKNGTKGKTISTKNRLINEFILENPGCELDKSWYKYKVNNLRKLLYLKNKQNKAQKIIKSILNDMKLNQPGPYPRQGAGTDLMFQDQEEEETIESHSKKYNIEIPYSTSDEQTYLAKRLKREVFQVLEFNFFECQYMCRMEYYYYCLNTLI